MKRRREKARGAAARAAVLRGERVVVDEGQRKKRDRADREEGERWGPIERQALGRGEGRGGGGWI